jgi:hypothetical protein
MSGMKTKIYLLLVVLLTLSGCHRSGTWTDDPKNWKRAFRSHKPKDVVVVHSKYWRSPHFTLEFRYFFHIKANQALRKQLFECNELVCIEDSNAVSVTLDQFFDKPDWFVPKSPEEYEVWEYKEETIGNFKVFIDMENQDLFLADELL